MQPSHVQHDLNCFQFTTQGYKLILNTAVFTTEPPKNAVSREHWANHEHCAFHWRHKMTENKGDSFCYCNSATCRTLRQNPKSMQVAVIFIHLKDSFGPASHFINDGNSEAAKLAEIDEFDVMQFLDVCLKFGGCICHHPPFQGANGMRLVVGAHYEATFLHQLFTGTETNLYLVPQVDHLANGRTYNHQLELNSKWFLNFGCNCGAEQKQRLLSNLKESFITCFEPST